MISPADLQLMTEREKARNAALAADPDVAAALQLYEDRYQALDTARRELEDASYRLGVETRRVLSLIP